MHNLTRQIGVYTEAVQCNFPRFAPALSILKLDTFLQLKYLSIPFELEGFAAASSFSGGRVIVSVPPYDPWFFLSWVTIQANFCNHGLASFLGRLPRLTIRFKIAAYTFSRTFVRPIGNIKNTETNQLREYYLANRNFFYLLTQIANVQKSNSQLTQNLIMVPKRGSSIIRKKVSNRGIDVILTAIAE